MLTSKVGRSILSVVSWLEGALIHKDNAVGPFFVIVRPEAIIKNG